MWSVLRATFTPGAQPLREADERPQPRARPGAGSERVGVLVVPGRLRVDGTRPAAAARRGRLRRGEVGVDQREAPVADRAVGVGRLERVEHRVHARVAGDVRAHLPAQAMAGADDVPDLLRARGSGSRGRRGRRRRRARPPPGRRARACRRCRPGCRRRPRSSAGPRAAGRRPRRSVTGSDADERLRALDACRRRPRAGSRSRARAGGPAPAAARRRGSRRGRRRARSRW